MRLKTVLILAGLAALTGCGVGVDDPEGALASGSPAHQTQALDGVPSPGDFQQTAANPTGSVTPGGDVALPQDPIPLHPGGPVDPLNPAARLRPAAGLILPGR